MYPRQNIDQQKAQTGCHRVNGQAAGKKRISCENFNIWPRKHNLCGSGLPLERQDGFLRFNVVAVAA